MWRPAHTLRAVTVFAVSMSCLMAMESAARAKGPSQGTIEGPGISSRIELRVPGAATIGPALAAIVQKSGFFVGLACPRCDEGLRRRPDVELGPRYTVTYTLAGPGGPSTIVQRVFPFAAPRPVTYMPPHQRYWGSGTTPGTWYVARVGLLRLLVNVGVPRMSPPPEAASGTLTGGANDSRPMITWIAFGVVALSVAAVVFWMVGHSSARVGLPANGS